MKAIRARDKQNGAHNFKVEYSVTNILPIEGRGENTILVVNDQPDQLELMSTLLRHAGYRVLNAFDGREGFEIARRERPDMVISDVLMPCANGIELCRLLRADRD